LLDDGLIEIEFAYRNGDEAVLKAKREPFSAACSHVRSQQLWTRLVALAVPRR
jgi:hypothetical protein